MLPLYEGIALIQEKQAVVLDLGYDHTKFGYAGEAAPRCIVRSEFWCTSARKMKRLFDYSGEEELYTNLVDMLHMLYFKHGLMNPKERKVVVVESLLTPTLFRETLAKVLYLHYEVSGVVWADSARLCGLTLGAQHALVVDIGAREAEVTAVVHGSPILRALQSAALGSRAVRAELARLLDEDNGDRLQLSDERLEDIQVKTLFVGPRARHELWRSADESRRPAPAKRVLYPLPGRSAITVSGRTRELAAAVLFDRDNEMSSLGDIVLQCISQCPIDTRRPLAENILVVGGTANLPGLKARLAEELRHLVTLPPYSAALHPASFKFHSAPAQLNSTAWLGAALLGASIAFSTRSCGRDVYTRRGRVPDWPSLLHNTPPNHYHFNDLNDENRER